LVLPIAYSQDARTNFDVKYADGHGSVQGVAKTVFKFYPPPKTANFVANFPLSFFGRKPPYDKTLPYKRRHSPIKLYSEQTNYCRPRMAI